MKIELLLSLDQEKGQLNVSGAIENPLVAYGLLELAKQQLVAHYAAKAAGTDSRIQPATFFPGLKSGN